MSKEGLWGGGGERYTLRNLHNHCFRQIILYYVAIDTMLFLFRPVNTDNILLKHILCSG